MSVADRITKILTEKGLSQRDVERAAGMKKGHLSVILERGGGMHKDTAPRVAEALGVSLGWLLTGEGEAPAAVDARRAKPLSAALSPLPLDRVIDDVFDGRAHKPSDAAAVRALLVGGFTLTSPRDAGALIRTLLDAAAKLRLAGVTKITPSTLLEAVALRVVELEAPAAASEIAPSLAAPSSGRPPSQPGVARRVAGALSQLAVTRDDVEDEEPADLARDLDRGALGELSDLVALVLAEIALKRGVFELLPGRVDRQMWSPHGDPDVGDLS